MSEIFKIYESTFKSVCKKIDSILVVEEYNYKTIKDLRSNIQEVNRIVKQMSLEVNNFKTTKKKISKEIEQNLKRYQSLVDSYNKKLLEIQENINKDNNINSIDVKDKNILIDEDNMNAQKKGLIEDEYTQQQKLNYIGREMTDIENIGNNINEKLYGQTEQMKEMRDNVFNMNNEIDVSNSLINKIMKQAKRNKMLMYGSGVLIALIFIMFLIFKFK
jgi:predicted  nucleic acid-binding Zn-ribbon protein